MVRMGNAGMPLLRARAARRAESAGRVSAAGTNRNIFGEAVNLDLHEYPSMMVGAASRQL